MLSLCRLPSCIHSWCRARPEPVITFPMPIPHSVYICMQNSLCHASLISPCSAKDLCTCLNLSLRASCLTTQRSGPVACLSLAGSAAHNPCKSKACVRTKGYECWGSKWTIFLCKNACHYFFLCLSNCTNHLMDFPDDAKGKIPMGSSIL